jgi:hypothetical protein
MTIISSGLTLYVCGNDCTLFRLGPLAYLARTGSLPQCPVCGKGTRRIYAPTWEGEVKDLTAEHTPVGADT